MNSDVYLKQAERDARFVEVLVLARYALKVHDGVAVFGDGGNRVCWPLNICFERGEIDDVLQMAGIDTTAPLRPALRSPSRTNPDDAPPLNFPDKT